MNSDLFIVSIILLALFSFLSFFDGVYYHLVKYKLQENKDSKKEHLTHTLRAILFIPIVLFIFYWKTTGWMLWIGLFFVVCDFIVEAIDVFEERKSRIALGGLSSGEYFLHIVLTTLRVSSLSFALAARPLIAYSHRIELAHVSTWHEQLVFQLIPGAIVVATLHLVLIVRPYLISELQKYFMSCCRGCKA